MQMSSGRTLLITNNIFIIPNYTGEGGGEEFALSQNPLEGTDRDYRYEEVWFHSHKILILTRNRHA